MSRASPRLLRLARVWLALAVSFAGPLARAQTPDVVLSPPADLARFMGLTIVKVEAVLDDDTWPDVGVPTIHSIKHGERFSEEAARRALAEVMATGAYARGRVSVAEEGVGVKVSVHVVARKIVEALHVDAHGAPVDADEIAREAALAEGGEVVGATFEALRGRVKELFARRGWPAAEVTVSTRATNVAQRVLVYLDVQPGSPRVLQKRVFYTSNDPFLKLQDLAERQYAVPEGGRADLPALDASDAKLEATLASRGYHRAEVSHDVIVWNGLVTLRVRVDAGPLFQPRFEGNDHYDSAALGGALDLENDTDRSPGHMVQKLKDFYARRGYLDAEVQLEARGGDKDPLHLLVFVIRERPRVFVARREYPCVKEDEIRRLKDGGPRSAPEIGNEIDSYLEEELPGADIVEGPDPRGVDQVVGPGLGEVQTGARAVPVELRPNTAYVPDTYEKALTHVRELYRNEGFLHAEVGPVQVLRRRCAPRSPAGTCVPVRTSSTPADACTYDANNLPLPVDPLDPVFSCVPDSSRGIECESTVSLRIPVKLGPRTRLYDLTFAGLTAFSERAAADVAQVPLGDPVNALRLEDARRRLIDLYKEEGFAYADVKYSLEDSPDHTRTRARFEVSEGERVTVKDIVIRGNRLTHEATIRKRVALEVGGLYRASLIRRTQERVATLNVFSGVTVELSEPYVPQKQKTVVVTVVETMPQVIGQEGGFNTGEGLFYGFEYAHRNLFGSAVGFSLRGRLSYLPDPVLKFVATDPQLLQNWLGDGTPTHPALETANRIAWRATASLAFPELGLGPLVRGQFDAMILHDLQRDFFITKAALVPSAQFRPARELVVTLSQTAEDNYLKLFQFQTLTDYLDSIAAANQNAIPADLVKYLLFPDGYTLAFAQRLNVAWDRRNDSFNARSGTYVVSGVEHVDWFDLNTDKPGTASEGHFLRFTETLAGYIPLPRGMRIAAEVRFGANVQLTQTSTTYPDRLFFMGGPDSMRGWPLRSFMPQDDIDEIAVLPDCVAAGSSSPIACGAAGAVSNPAKFQPVRGGNLMVNPRLELRVPVKSPVEVAFFSDAGNLWRKASYPFDTGKFPLRVSVGAGLRVQTPVGPLALDYGINLTRHAVYAQEDFGALHFAIGLF